MKFVRALKIPAAAFAVVILTLNWFFGFEPQLWLSSGFNKMGPVSYEQYMASSVAHNGNSVAVRVLTTVVYPGALAGRLVHNTLYPN